MRVCSGGNISPCPGTNLPCVEWTLKGFGCPHPRLLHVRSLLALSSSLPISIRWDIIKRDPYAGCAKKDPGKDGRASSVRLKTGAGGGLTLFSLLTTSSVPWENGILHAMKICTVLQWSRGGTYGNTLSARGKNGSIYYWKWIGAGKNTSTIRGCPSGTQVVPKWYPRGGRRLVKWGQ